MSSIQKSVSELHSDIASYVSQLASVSEGLRADPENQELLKISADLTHLINLTRTLAEKTVSGNDSDDGFDVPDDVASSVFIRAETPSGSSAPFAVAETVEVISGDRPYAAVVQEINPDGQLGHVKVWYFEYNTEVVLPLSDLAKICKPTVKPSDLETLPYKCQCKYMVDQRWYDAEVTSKGRYGYLIQYTQYKQIEEVPVHYLRKVLYYLRKLNTTLLHSTYKLFTY